MTRKVWIDFGDVNWLKYGGKWIKRIDDSRYHVVELVNMEYVLGEQEASATGAKYNVMLSEVNLEIGDLNSAMASCGIDCETFDSDLIGYVLAERLHNYGYMAPLGDWSGNNAHMILKEARSESRRLIADYEYYDCMMERTVNLLGSTAREYQAGDFESAIARGLFMRNRDCKITEGYN